MYGSPVKNALEQVIALFDLKDIRIYLYKEKNDFNALWDFPELSETVKNQSAIVIVWDGIPEKKRADYVDTGKYLTPVDWAVGFSLYSKNKSPKIIIIDALSNLSGSDSNLSIIPQIMPWVFIPKMNDILNCLCQLPKPETEADMGFIRNVWAARLTRPSDPGDHHAIANLVGPLLLTDEETDSHITALRNLMAAVELLPKEDKKAESLLKSNSPWINWHSSEWEEKLNGVLRTDTKLNLVLVDDMWFTAGWGKMLCWAVGATYDYVNTDRSDKTKPIKIGSTNDKKMVVYAASSAQWLINKLKNLKNAGTMDQRFQFSLIDEEVTKNSLEILFLDLRLFTEKDISNKEVEFYKDLLSIAEEFEQSKDSDLPWDGFKKEGEINKIKTWLDSEDKKREVDEHITALTFLPRILALTDLSLPIVLFSSTGRRDIAEMLKPYGNIITVFDKPKFTVDIPENIAKQTARKFHDAVEKALLILEGRNLCKKLFGLFQTNQGNQTGWSSVSEIKHIEVYLDETDKTTAKYFTVGGLVLGYKNYNDVMRLHKELIQNKVYWYSDDIHDNQFLSKRPGKANSNRDRGLLGTAHSGITEWNYRDIRDKFVAAAGSINVFVAAVSLKDTLGPMDANFRHFPLKDCASDERNFRALMALLEVILCEMIPKWANGQTVTVSVFGVTRTPPLTMMGTLELNETPTDYFGYGKNSIGNYYTVSEGSIVPQVATLLKMRPNLPLSVTVHHARANILFYGIPNGTKNKQPWKNMRTQHYLADNVLAEYSVYQAEFKNGFAINADEDFYTFLKAQREMLDDTLPAAIRMAATCNKADDRVTRHILEKIIEGVNGMSGEGFINICRQDIEENQFRRTMALPASIAPVSDHSEASAGGSATISAYRSLSSLPTIIYQVGQRPPEDRCISEQEKITIKRIITFGSSQKFEGKRDNNQIVYISSNQTKKLGRKAFTIKIGDKVSVDIFSQGQILFGRNIIFPIET
jgi:hypothetical protein